MKFKKLRKTISFNDSIILDITDKNGNSTLLSYANISGVPNKFNKYKVNGLRISVIKGILFIDLCEKGDK